MKIVGLILLLVSNELFAVNIQGRVDIMTRFSYNPTPLPGAQIYLINTRSKQVFSASSGKNGMYIIYNMPAGNYDLVVNGRVESRVFVPYQTKNNWYSIQPVVVKR